MAAILRPSDVHLQPPPTPPIGPLALDDVVLRGGIMQPRDMHVNAYTHYDHTGEFALSVFAVPGWTIEEITRAAGIPNGQIRGATVGRILDAGYEIVRSQPPPGHADIRLPNPPTDQDWVALRDVFDDPIQNPHPRPKE